MYDHPLSLSFSLIKQLGSKLSLTTRCCSYEDLITNISTKCRKFQYNLARSIFITYEVYHEF